MNKIFLILLVCLIASCSLPNRVNEKMDITRYKSAQVNGVAHITLNNGIILEQSQSSDGGYIQRSIYPSYPNYPSFNGINLYKEFYDSGELKVWAIAFCNDFYNRSKTYGKDGKEITEKSINHDLPYKFSLGYIQKKIKKEFDIDIYNGNCFASRNADTKPPVYHITLPVPNDFNIKRYLTVDANTGVIISNVTEPVAN